MQGIFYYRVLSHALSTPVSKSHIGCIKSVPPVPLVRPLPPCTALYHSVPPCAAMYRCVWPCSTGLLSAPLLMQLQLLLAATAAQPEFPTAFPTKAHTVSIQASTVPSSSTVSFLPSSPPSFSLLPLPHSQFLSFAVLTPVCSLCSSCLSSFLPIPFMAASDKS